MHACNESIFGGVRNELAVATGTCFPLFAFEVAQAIDLDAAERRLLAGAERQTIKHKRRAPASFEYRPAPLRVSRAGGVHALGEYRTTPGVEVVLYDFGAVSVSYAIPIAGTLSDLPALAEELWGNERLLADSRRQVEELLSLLGDAAILFDPEGEDVRDVIEFANTQLLEMRFLDQQLDDALERAYDSLLGRPARLWGPGQLGPDLRRLARMQLDSAILFEQVTNALKLVGDQFLARVYSLASRRFHLAEWDASISRKLQTIDGIYAKMTDRATSRRTEMLEWIIIVLIAVGIGLSLITLLP